MLPVMRLMDQFNLILAKAMPSLFGEGFEARKSHLHPETRVDKRGHTSRRWVKNKDKKDDVAPPMQNLFAPPEPTPPPTPLFDIHQLLQNAATPKPAAPKRPKAAKTKPPVQEQQEQPKPNLPLFNFDFAPPSNNAPTLLDLNAAAARPKADGSMSMTQDEYRAQQAHALHVGDKKTVDGVTYELNDNHRWQRQDEPETSKVTPSVRIDRPADPEGEEGTDEYLAHLARGSAAYERLVEESKLEARVQIQLTGGVPNDWSVHERATESVEDQIDAARERLGLPELPPLHSDNLKLGGPAAATDEPWESPDLERNADHQTALDWLLKRRGKDKALDNILSSSPHEAKMFLPERMERALYPLASEGKYSLFERLRTPERLAALSYDLYHATRDAAPITATSTRVSMDYTNQKTFFQTMPKFAFDLLARSTRATRRTANTAALKLAKAIEARGTPATAEERETLAKWSGQGGVDGDRNAYYTPTKLAASMWEVMRRNGLPSDARVLEPSIGGGVFAETRPEKITMVGVEYNEDTACVARALHPDVQIHHAPFEKYNTTSADELFDAVIGNPPYGGRGDLNLGTTRDLDKPDYAEAEQYFLDTSLDRVKAGGLVTMLVNFGVMQNQSARSFRAHMLARAELVSAVRVPVSTFEDAGAMVTPDILVFRKRPEGVGEALASAVDKYGEDALKWAGVYRDDVLSGEYFAKAVRNEAGEIVDYEAGHHPERVIGTVGKVMRAQHGGLQMAVHGELDDNAIRRICGTPADVQASGPRNLDDLEGCLTRGGMAESDVKAAITYGQADHYPIPEGAISSDGNLVFRNHRWHRISANDMPVVANAITLARNIEKLAGLIASGATQSAEALRLATAEGVHTYLQRFGDPNSNSDVRGALSRLPFLNHLLASVQGGQLAGRLTEPVETYKIGDHVDSSNPDQVCAALASQARLTPELLAEITGLSVSDARHHLFSSDAYAYNGQRWVKGEDYYWGDVYQQSDAARQLARATTDPQLKAKLEKQADHFLTLTQRVPITDIDFSARDKWIPIDIVESWINDTLGTTSWEQEVTREGERTSVRKNMVQLEYKGGIYSAVPRRDSNSSRSAWRSIKESDVQGLLNYLNRKTRVESVNSDLDADEKARQRAANVQAAKDYEQSLKGNFQGWAFSNEAQQTIEEEYNRSVNSFVAGRDDTEPFHLDGWQYDKLQPHPFQYATVRKAISQGSSYIALDVGLGKTSTALMLVNKLKQEGHARKPTVIVPKSVLGQWAEEVERVTPGKKVLLIGLSRNKSGKLVEDSPETKQKKLAQLAAEDWDLVLMNHELFEAIPMRRETRLDLINTDFERQRLEGLRNEGKFKKDGGLKANTQTEAADFATDQLEKVKVAGETDIAFEDLGIDCLIADEAHNYKNLLAAPSVFGQSIKFLGAGAESNQAMEFHHKARYIRQQNGGQGGVHCMSATPTKNSPLELYYALQFVTDELAERGIPGASDFLDRYCEMGNVIVPNRSGTLTSQVAVTGFKNLDELRSIMGRYLIRETAQTALIKDKVSGELRQGLPMPQRDDRQVMFDMHPEVASRMADLRFEAGKVNMREAGGSGRFLRLMDEMTKLSLDPALASSRLGQHKNPRFVHAAKIAKAGLDEGGKAIIFMERGETGLDGKEKDNNAYTRLKAELVAHGIPEDQIEIITATTAKGAARTRASERFQSGQTRVIIGNRTIEEGMNLQNGTTDMIHMDSPWDPGSYWQRLGRAWRQGNKASTVRNHVLLARGSMDQFRYTSMLGKKGWSDTLWDASIKDGNNGDLEAQMDELQLELAPNRLQAQQQINSSRDSIKASQRAAMIRRGTQDLKTLTLLRAGLKKCVATAAARKEGPTANDRSLIERSRLSISRLTDQIQASAYPFKQLLNHDHEILFSEQGIPYTRGMQFSGSDLHAGNYEVEGVDTERGNVFVRNLDTGKKEWMRAGLLAKHSANHVLGDPTPTPTPAAA